VKIREDMQKLEERSKELTEKFIFKLCPFKALKHRQLLALGIKQ